MISVSGFREKDLRIKVHADDNHDGHSLIARVTLTR